MRLWAFACAAFLLSSVSLDAAAFCRTSTDGLAEGCHPSGTNCCTIGKPIYWKNACISFSMQRLGTQKLRTISFVEAQRTVAQAFNVWTSASCPGGESSSRVSIDVRQFPPVDCAEVDTKLDLPNQNVIVFRDSVWNHRDPDNVLALTTVSFDKTTGEIRGADLEFNSANINMVCPSNNTNDDNVEASCFDAPPPEGAYDFASIVTHEVGHYLGMAHSNNPQATMAPQYTGGKFTLRTLTADDIAGICSVYPPNGTRNTGDNGSVPLPEGPCDPTPLNGFSVDCAEKKCFIFCCSSAGVGALPPGTTAFGLSFGGGLAALLGIRRARRARRTRS